MSTPDKPQYDHTLLIQYLLGAVPETEANRLDELSIVDDDFADHLAAAENDLVDAYVRGELDGADLGRFQSHYLSSPVRREKVQFAEALAAVDRAPGLVETEPKNWLRSVSLLAAAACLLLLAGGVVFYQNGQLRSQIGQIRQDRDALHTRERSLQQELESLRAAPVQNPGALAPSLSAVALVLMPQTRGIEPPATVALASHADAVSLQLQLDDESFPAYRVILKDPASNRSVWQSPPLLSQPRGDIKVVPVSLPAALLTPRIYGLELTGIPARGAAVSLSSYSLRVVR